MDITKAVADKFRSLSDEKICEMVGGLCTITINGSEQPAEKRPAKLKKARAPRAPAPVGVDHPCWSVLKFLQDHPGEVISASEVVVGSGLEKKAVLKGLAVLCEQGKALKSGEKRGTKYALA